MSLGIVCLLLVCPALLLRGEALLSLKIFPPQARPYLGERPLQPAGEKKGSRLYRLPAGRLVLTLKADKYLPKRLHLEVSGDLAVEEKLERADSRLVLAGEFATGPAPKSLNFAPDGRAVVVPLLYGGGLDRLDYDPASPAVLGPARPLRLAEGGRAGGGFVETVGIPGRGELWVTEMHAGLVHVLDASSGARLASIPTGGRWPKAAALAADQKLVFVSNWESHDISVIDAAARRVERLIKVSGIPRGLAASPDGRWLYVCIFESGDIEKIDLAVWKPAGRLRFGAGAARHIVIHAASRRAYVSDMAAGRINVFSTDNDGLLASARVGPNLNTIALSSRGEYLFASVRGLNDPIDYTRKGPEFGRLVVLEASTLREVDWAWGRNQPTGLAVSPDDRYVMFTDFLDNNVEIYDLGALWKK